MTDFYIVLFVHACLVLTTHYVITINLILLHLYMLRLNYILAQWVHVKQGITVIIQL